MNSKVVLVFSNQQISCFVDDEKCLLQNSTKNASVSHSLKSSKTDVQSCRALAKSLLTTLDPSVTYTLTIQGKKNRYHGKIKAFIDEITKSSINLVNRRG